MASRTWLSVGREPGLEKSARSRSEHFTARYWRRTSRREDGVKTRWRDGSEDEGVDSFGDVEVVELMRFVTERAVLAPRMEEYAQTESISSRPPKGHTIVAKMSMAAETGRRPVAMTASFVALDFVRIMLSMNSALTFSSGPPREGGYIKTICSRPMVRWVSSPDSSWLSSACLSRCSEDCPSETRLRNSMSVDLTADIAHEMPCVALLLIPFQLAVLAVLFLADRTSFCHFRWTL